MMVLTLGAAAGCDVNTALEHQAEARRLAAGVLIEFTKAGDASLRAVMADTDEASVAFAREAEQATQAARRTPTRWGRCCATSATLTKTRLFEQFVSRFSDYRAMDRRILDLAVENTNLKAQQLSFGPAREAADTFRDSLAAVVPLRHREREAAGWTHWSRGRSSRARGPGAAGAAHRRRRRRRDDAHGAADGDVGGGRTERGRTNRDAWSRPRPGHGWPTPPPP